MQIAKIEVGLYQVNCYAAIDETNRKALIVDPGDEPERISSWIDRLQAVPEAIFITHGHFDHIGAAVSLAQTWQVPILTSLDELVYMQDRSHPLMAMTAGILDEFLAAAPQTVRGLRSGDVVQAAGEQWRVIEVPGHSDHSLCLYTEGILFAGDTLFAGSMGRTDLYHGSPNVLANEIENQLMTLPPDTVVYPGHGPETSIARESRINPFLRR